MIHTTCVVPGRVRVTETGSRGWGQEWGRGGSRCLIGAESQFGKMKVLETDGGDGRTKM